MTTVDFASSNTHYADHLLPIWLALPPSARGRWFADRTSRGHVAAHVPGSALRAGDPSKTGQPIVVASHVDYQRARGRPVALVEHGAGQTYGDGNPGNAGGRNRERVGLFICPHPTVAAANLAAWPRAHAVAAGCPKLDRWPHPVPRPSMRGPKPEVVAVTWHWDCQVAPQERRSAWDHYGPATLHMLATWAATADVQLLGHAHPRILRRIRPEYNAAGIPVADHLDQVLDTASLLIADNTSAMYEAAALGIPVIALNAPWYRRDVHHGLRFWDHVPGPQVDHHDQLLATIEAVLADPTDALASGHAAAAACYVERDGRAAQRAACAVLDWLATNPTPETSVANPYQPQRRTMAIRPATLEHTPPLTMAAKKAARATKKTSKKTRASDG